MRQHKYDYDAFISHAVEDKIPIANELCGKLERAGLRIWYSGKELGIGDSIEKTIENGLHRSRYGIVILSPTYLAKNWTIREFYTLLAKEIKEHKVILPVLYNITLDDLKKKDLLMADRFAVNADRGIDYVVERLVHEIRRPKPQRTRAAWFSRIWLVLILSLLANVALVVKGMLPESHADQIALEPATPGMGGQMMNANFFNEMQGLFTHLNTCSCPSRTGGDAVVRTGIPTNQSASFRPSGQPASSFDRPAVQRGGKMTMAVVFQIEAPADAQKPEVPVEQEVNEMLETIGAADEQPFIMVSNRESRDTGDRRSCLRR